MHELYHRFAKDYSLPIRIYSEPYFSYLIGLYDLYLKTVEKLNLLNETVEELGGKENFFLGYNKIKEDILSAIKGTPAYDWFNNTDMDKYNIKNNFPKKDVFNMGNVRKYFMSIDLKRANFTAMKYFDESLVLGCQSYEDLMYKFTDLEYMVQSKYIRQVIFGNLNPARQVKIEQFLISKVLELLVSDSTVREEDVMMLSSDEIVVQFDIEDWLLTSNYNLYIEKKIKYMLDLNVDVEIYRLMNIEPFPYFVKEFINKSGFEIMCVPAPYFPQVYKEYTEQELNENDLVFWHENQLVKFLKPLKNLYKTT